MAYDVECLKHVVNCLKLVLCTSDMHPMEKGRQFFCASSAVLSTETMIMMDIKIKNCTIESMTKSKELPGLVFQFAVLKRNPDVAMVIFKMWYYLIGKRG